MSKRVYPPGDRHRRPPLTIRLGEHADFYDQLAADTGRPIRSLIGEALAEYRSHNEARPTPEPEPPAAPPLARPAAPRRSAARSAANMAVRSSLQLHR